MLCCLLLCIKVLKVRDSTTFLTLTAEQRRNVFKDAAAEVSRMVSMQQTTSLLLAPPTTTATLLISQLEDLTLRLRLYGRKYCAASSVYSAHVTTAALASKAYTLLLLYCTVRYCMHAHLSSFCCIQCAVDLPAAGPEPDCFFSPNSSVPDRLCRAI
jgi:hypothetical protein